jgi:hypothetical protein
MGNNRLTHEYLIPVPSDPDTSDEGPSNEDSVTVETSTEDESSSWVSSLRNKKILWKGAGIAGAATITLVHFTVDRLAQNPIYAIFSTLVPIGLGICAVNSTTQANNKDLEVGFTSFTLSAIGATVLNTMGTLLPGHALTPVVVPIVSLGIVAGTNIMTPELCINVAKVSEKLSKVSDSCFSLWKKPCSRNNIDETSLEDVVSESHLGLNN